MRALVVRQRLSRSAVLVASVALLAACGAKHNTGPGGSDALGDTAGLTAGSLLLSNGTSTVVVGGRAFTFPTTVTDAAFSPDGSRIAFVNADGNIATARVDGSGMRVLTKPAAGTVRSRPTWAGSQVVFAEKSGSKPSTLRAVYANGADAVARHGEVDAELGVRADDDSDDFTSGSVPTGMMQGDPQSVTELAFQRQGAHGGEVWLSDINQRQPHQSKVVDGTEPALSPDGRRVAYVDTKGQIEIADAFDRAVKPLPVTFGVAAPTHLVWTPDGARITFATATDVESVTVAVAAGTTSNPTKQESATVGVPAYLPPARDQISRITGADPIETSIAASQVRWPTIPKAYESEGFQVQARAVLLAGTANLPAMLAGAQMVDDGPLLFTSGATLNAHTAAEIKRVLGQVEDPQGFVPTVTILGGTDVVPTQAENAIKAMGYHVDRVAGKDAYAMAVTAAGKPADADPVLVVDAADVASYASAISDLGAYSHQTVLVTNGSTMPDGAKTFLNGLKKTAKVYGLGAGAQAALASSWSGKPAVTIAPIAGTAALLGAYAGPARALVIVDSSSTTDVIAAIGLARGYWAPVLALDTKAGLDDGIKAWLDGSSGTIDNVMIVDSKGAVSADFEHSVAALLGGPLGAASNTNPKAAPRP